MHSIKDIKEKIKGYWSSGSAWSDDLFLLAIIILVAFFSFGLGRLSALKEAKTPLQIENTPNEVLQGAQTNHTQTAHVATVPTSEIPQEATYVASKTGKKYHYPWCAGAQRISEENRVYFKSKEEAEAQGYTPASNCKGL